MAFSKEGWRTIVVEDQVYYWQTAEWIDLFLVRPDREPHRLLRVMCGSCSRGHTFSGRITPRIVRLGIEDAVQNAWPQDRPQMRSVVFSDPLRYLSVRRSWLTSSVVALAQGIVADRAFERMPILADALQDAGCDNDDILTHCRDEKAVDGQGPKPLAPHVDGCWVVGLLLRKD